MMTNPIPEPIAECIHRHHVVSLACTANGELWCASCFYVADLARQRLIILTDSQTRHGRLMRLNHQIAGTIAGQPKEIYEIEGVQFQGVATQLSGEAQALALADYIAHFPVAKMHKSEVWEIVLTQLKHTENRTAFATKREWYDENY